MKVQESFLNLLNSADTNLKTGINKIRYELAQKRLSKTPRGADIYLEQSIDLLSSEILKVLNEVKYLIFKAREWEPIRFSITKFIEEQCNQFSDFLVSDWEQPASRVTNQLVLLKSSVLGESNNYIDRQKVKLSKGEHTMKDIMKILFCGVAAGLVGFFLMLLLSH